MIKLISMLFCSVCIMYLGGYAVQIAGTNPTNYIGVFQLLFGIMTSIFGLGSFFVVMYYASERKL